MSLYGGIGSNFAFLKETGSVKKERKMTIELIFKIAAVGILVTILGQVPVSYTHLDYEHQF